MTSEEIEDRLRRAAESAEVELASDQLGRLTIYVELLRRWNRTVSLTSLDIENLAEAALLRLVVEPIAMAYLVPLGPIRWVDLGSGGGSPAIPLKVLRPDAVLSMVESRGRKASFLREAIRACRLATTDVLSCRIEELARTIPPGSVELFTARALRITESIGRTVTALSGAGAGVILFGAPDWTGLSTFAVEDRSDAGGGVLRLRRRPPDVSRGTQA